jgi:hypothetical protein
MNRHLSVLGYANNFAHAHSPCDNPCKNDKHERPRALRVLTIGIDRERGGGMSSASNVGAHPAGHWLEAAAEAVK